VKKSSVSFFKRVAKFNQVLFCVQVISSTMSFFFGNDLWDEMDRMQRQLEDLTSELDYKRPRIAGSKAGKKACGKQQCCKALSPFSTEEMSVFNPVTDLAENDKSYVVSMDLPGVKKDELNITIHNGVLTVSGTRHHKFESHDDDEEMSDGEKKKEEKKSEPTAEPAAEPSAAAATEEEKKKEPEKKETEKKPKHKVIRMESFYGSFERSIAVPVHTTSEDVHAKFEDGVLTITIDKPKKEEMKKIEIQ